MATTPSPLYPPIITIADFPDKLDAAYAGGLAPAPLAKTIKPHTHHNTVAATSYGVTKIYLKSTSGTLSPSYGGTAYQKGADDFHFAPSVEAVQIVYHVKNPKGAIARAKLELFDRFAVSPIWKSDLTPLQYTEGDHTMPFTGAVAVDAAKFPDGFLTVEHSPYKLKITVGGKIRSTDPVAWTEFHVLVADLTLELGPKATLKAKDQKVYESLTTVGGLPPEGAAYARAIRLLSNIFKTASAEMYDNTAFTEYKSAWKDGALLPIFAKVRVLDSSDKKVDAPKSLGKVKFLWDWEDVTEDSSALTPPATRSFVDNAVNLDRLLTLPKGDNCHVERGGKRGAATGAKVGVAVFPTATGQAQPHAGSADPPVVAGTLPFKVEACGIRTHSAFSYAWTRGIYAGKTGVFFQPCRIAGDAYKVTVYLAWDRKSDGTIVADVQSDAPLPAAIKAATGSIKVWRQVDLVKYIKKNSSLVGFSVTQFQSYYDKALILMVDNTGGASSMVEADYRAKVRTTVLAQPWLTRAAVDPTVNQYTAGNFAVAFRNFNDFTNAIMAAKGFNAAQLAAFLGGPGSAVATASLYHGICKDWARTIVESSCDGYLGADDGVNIIQFSGLYNLETQPGGKSLNGFAANFTSGGRNKCAFVQCAPASSYTGNSNTMEQTISHEIGHHLFLPHAVNGVPAGGGPDATSHDAAWDHCMMSYNYTAERKFCGLCLLRLRGWDKTNLKTVAVQNRRP